MIRASRSFVLATLASILVVTSASAIGLKDISWETVGPEVEITMIFINDEEVPPLTSPPYSVSVSTAPLGAFPEEQTILCEFTVPPLDPGATYTASCSGIEGEEIPDRAETIEPGPGNPGAGNQCQERDYWHGSVFVRWKEDDVPVGGLDEGYAEEHRAELNGCYDFGESCVAVQFGCDSEAPWSITGICDGWSARLVTDSFEDAPNPLPAGPFSGWICVLPPDALSGSCTVQFEITCDDVTEYLAVYTEICNCGAVAVEPASWGRIKAGLRGEDD